MQHFEQEISQLKQTLLAMAGEAESAVNQAIKALVDRDDDVARAVKEHDDVVDRFEKQIDEQAIALLSSAAGHRPAAHHGRHENHAEPGAGGMKPPRSPSARLS